MKKQLLKIAALSAAVLFTGSVFAQDWAPKSVDVGYTTTAPEIDGVADAVWGNVAAVAIDVPFAAETVSLGDGATFKALWDDDNVYLLITVPDDNHYNHVDAGVNSWQADKPEVYFDVTSPLVDGGGPSDDKGHYQAAPDFGPAPEEPNPYASAFVVEAAGTGYVYEYSFPYTWLVDASDVALDPQTFTTIGFDITILDLDKDGEGENVELGRINWSNNTTDVVEGGTAGESWGTLDQAGAFNFVDVVSVRTATVNNTMVYPNVATDMITVNVEAAEYSVINSLGQVVMVSEDNVINVSSLETGVYFVKANNEVARILKK